MAITRVRNHELNLERRIENEIEQVNSKNDRHLFCSCGDPCSDSRTKCRATHSDLFHVPSLRGQRMLVTRSGVINARLIRTPFYIETADWDTSVYNQFFKDKKYVLYFGRFQLQKGFHTLAQALPKFLNQCPDAHVALVGRDMETSLSSSMASFARAQCNGEAERLLILENLPHSKLYPIIAGAHLIALPSLIDNLPNTCLEAMGFGKVVVGTHAF